MIGWIDTPCPHLVYGSRNLSRSDYALKRSHDHIRIHGEPQADARTVSLWAQDHDGWLTMDATATLR